MLKYFTASFSSNILKRKLLILLLFFTSAPITIITSSLILININKSINEKFNDEHINFYDNPVSGAQVFASLPSYHPEISIGITSSDSRQEMIRQYLLKYNSPLTPYAYVIVEAADKFGIDYRLTTAIAQQESNLCKKIPAESFNCWGWGIHSQGTLGFISFEEGIWTVTEGIKKNYVDQGYKNVEDIMAKYTPLSQGSWAHGVTTFMKEME